MSCVVLSPVISSWPTPAVSPVESGARHEPTPAQPPAFTVPLSLAPVCVQVQVEELAVSLVVQVIGKVPLKLVVPPVTPNTCPSVPAKIESAPLVTPVTMLLAREIEVKSACDPVSRFVTLRLVGVSARRSA